MRIPSVLRHAGRVAAPIVIATASLHAQAPGGRLQFVVPPSTWRLTVSGDVLLPTAVKRVFSGVAGADEVGVSRGTIRVGVPVWKRGLYTTVVTNDVVYDRFDLSYGSTGEQAIPAGPATLHGLQHELGISHAMTSKWRLTGALQHGFFTSGGALITTASYRAAGGAFVSRVYRPTLQVGAGIVALNVAPYVIPTVRILHVGQKWRTDVLLPRAETFRDIGHGVEVGGVLRFLGNRWEGDGAVVRQSRIVRTTYQQAMVGPALTWRAGTHGLLQAEAGLALRRMLVTQAVRQQVTSGPEVPFGRRLDTEAGGLVRLSGRLSF